MASCGSLMTRNLFARRHQLCRRLNTHRLRLFSTKSNVTPQELDNNHPSTSENVSEPTETADYTPVKSLDFEFEETERFREDLYVQLHDQVIEDMKLKAKYASILEGKDEEADELEYQQAYENQIRDVSGLRPMHQWMLHDIVPPMDTWSWQWNQDALKQRYARYGKASAVNPGVMWMTESELTEQKALDAHYNNPLKQTMKQAKKTRSNEEKQKLAREKEIEKRLADYPKRLAAWQEESEKLLAQERAEREEQERHIKEIKDEFGYYIDFKDKKYKKLLEEREKRAKKESKKKTTE